MPFDLSGRVSDFLKLSFKVELAFGATAKVEVNLLLFLSSRARPAALVNGLLRFLSWDPSDEF